MTTCQYVLVALGAGMFALTAYAMQGVRQDDLEAERARVQRAIRHEQSILAATQDEVIAETDKLANLKALVEDAEVAKLEDLWKLS